MLIKNGFLLNGATNRFEQTDLLIENEKEIPAKYSLRLSRISPVGLRERAQITLASLGEEK